jgi:CO/xanthine dehydrogenase FAD-binding subunit
MSSLAIHRSRSRIPDFSLLRPRSLMEACAIFDAEPDAVPLAGGLDVVNRMKEGGAPRKLVMLAGIENFGVIRLAPDESAIDIGAGACHDDVATNTLVRAHLPDLAICWDRIANIRIRMQGTVVGNLLAAMPGYEGPVLLTALGASLRYSTHDCSAAAITVAELGEANNALRRFHGLATAVRVPLPTTGTTRRVIYDRSLRPALSVALQVDHAGGQVQTACALLGGCHAWPVRRDLPVAGLTLSEFGAQARDIAFEAFAQLPPPTVPWFGALHYRERVAPILLSRLVAEVAR